MNSVVFSIDDFTAAHFTVRKYKISPVHLNNTGIELFTEIGGFRVIVIIISIRYLGFTYIAWPKDNFRLFGKVDRFVIFYFSAEDGTELNVFYCEGGSVLKL